MKVNDLVESLLNESAAWTFDYGGEFPQAWRVNVEGGLDVVYTDSGGRDISAVADTWPKGTTFESLPDHDPRSRAVIRADSGEGAEYDLVNRVSELIDGENAQEAWDLVMKNGKRVRVGKPPTPSKKAAKDAFLQGTWEAMMDVWENAPTTPEGKAEAMARGNKMYQKANNLMVGDERTRLQNVATSLRSVGGGYGPSDDMRKALEARARGEASRHPWDVY